MFYLIKNWIISSSSTLSIIQEWYETIEKDFSEEEMEILNNWWQYLDWEIIITPEYKLHQIQIKKQELSSQKSKEINTLFWEEDKLEAVIEQIKLLMEINYELTNALSEINPDILKKESIQQGLWARTAIKNILNIN